MKKLVQRRNKQLRVDEAQVETFRQRGFSVLDEKTGKVIGEAKGANPKKEAEALKKANKELTEENAILLAANEELRKRLEEAAEQESDEDLQPTE